MPISASSFTVTAGRILYSPTMDLNVSNPLDKPVEIKKDSC